MPTKQNPRNRSQYRPNPQSQHNNTNTLTNVAISDPTIHKFTFPQFQLIQTAGNFADREKKERGDEANPRGVTTREGPVIDGDSEVHVLVVDGPRAADKVFDKADEQKVEEKAKKEAEEGAVQMERVERQRREEERDGDWEPEAAVAREFEDAEEGSGDDGSRDSVEVEGPGVVEVD
ncbi:hypothetical protein Ancab_032482 [Ancistrocladus abbreviatus]